MRNSMSDNGVKLARWFDGIREIIEAAEMPFAKLAIFVLPVLAPLVPAVMTGMHMNKLLGTIFKYPELSFGLACVIALVLEMLGYVGAISFIRAFFDLLQKGTQYALSATLNGLAYIFYLVAMFFINVKLGQYFHVTEIINTIIGLLSFITVPTGLLAANHLSQRENEEVYEKRHQEGRQDRIARYKIKHGMNPDPAPVVYQSTTPSDQNTERSERKEKAASFYRERMWQFMDKKRSEGKILTVKQIVEHFDLDYERSKGFVSTQRTLWARERGVDLQSLNLRGN